MVSAVFSGKVTVGFCAKGMQTEQRLRVSPGEVDDLEAARDEHAIVALTDPQGSITCVNDGRPNAGGKRNNP